LGANSQESGAKCQESGAKSQEVGAKSQEPRPKSQVPAAKRQKPTDKSPEPGAMTKSQGPGFRSQSQEPEDKETDPGTNSHQPRPGGSRGPGANGQQMLSVRSQEPRITKSQEISRTRRTGPRTPTYAASGATQTTGYESRAVIRGSLKKSSGNWLRVEGCDSEGDHRLTDSQFSRLYSMT
jgi:hypothetical protein